MPMTEQERFEQSFLMAPDLAKGRGERTRIACEANRFQVGRTLARP
jgi:hypothetical protein